VRFFAADNRHILDLLEVLGIVEARTDFEFQDRRRTS
jgi:hypothetical protein